MTLRVGIFGRGRLGGLVAAAARSAPDLEVAWTLGRGDADPGPADVAIDVSHPTAVPAHLAWAVDTGTPLVIGATGWDHAELDRCDTSRTGVLVAPNFSLTVALLRRFALVLGRYAAQSPDPVDLAVLDRHHRGKVDAPSGTARLVAEALAEGAGRWVDDIEVTSQRLGAVVGLHEVRWQSPAESLTITHEVHSREVFAAGALAAARWLHGRTGLLTMDDLAAEVLDPLLAETVRKPGAHAAPVPA